MGRVTTVARRTRPDGGETAVLKEIDTEITVAGDGAPAGFAVNRIIVIRRELPQTKKRVRRGGLPHRLILHRTCTATALQRFPDPGEARERETEESMSRLAHESAAEEKFPGQFALWWANCERSLNSQRGQAVLMEMRGGTVGSSTEVAH